MDFGIAFTLAVVVAALGLMVFEVAAPDLVLVAALFSLAAVGILSPEEAFAGFANPAVVAIAALFAVSAALRETGALDLVAGRLLRGARSVGSATLRISLPVAAFSGFLNNAPIVAMMTPTVIDWSKRNGFSPSRFLLPLSYASILGSTLTIIGTSTILTVAGLVTQAGMPPLDFFEPFWVGLPMCLVGIPYLVFVVPRMLRDRVAPAEQFGERPREYTTAMAVQLECPLCDQTVEDAGLRNLPGLFLVEIDRDGRLITPVAPDEPIRAGDRLVFAGVVSTIIDLQRIRGLVPIADEDADDTDSIARDPRQRLVETVVSSSSPLVGRSIRESNFRTVYDAAVIAVHRNGERVPGKIGEIVLRPGDTLLLQSAPGFVRAHRHSRDFYLVSELGGSGRPRFERAGVAAATLAGMVVLVTTGVLSIAVAAVGAAGFLILTRCISGPQARESVEWSILIVIGAGLGIAVAMEKTGAAELVARALTSSVLHMGPWAALIVIYALTQLAAESLHHNAAVALMFPIAVATAGQVGVDPRPFVMAVAIAGCCSFANPVAYQTHLIVYGPGGYRFRDFMRAGLPLDLICGAIALALIPRLWPF